MNKYLLYILSATLFLSACSSSKNITQTRTLDTITVTPKEVGVYQATETLKFDLLHTKLEVSFDWDKQYQYGTAELTLAPYFYPQSVLELDAKGFFIASVGMLDGSIISSLDYEYDDKILTIDLNKTFTRKDTFKIVIGYTAKPNELEAGGSAAISSDKGLYFINPDGSQFNKPKQIWTQGETEAASCWFPTIDQPNERCTQEIYITVKNNYTTLSNGLLISSNVNDDGTRTDYWKMDLPHAPYLFMMAIGEFAVVKDKWGDIDVDYYVEPEYKEHAKAIFGNTPEMIGFYSELLGVTYPWSKYSQICVRDYVSGAMENTTATIYLEQIQKTEREMLDGDFETIIAHELFHQWFGDLVTCESWSNLALNESFANYGEYLWLDYKYGKYEAEHHRRKEWEGYFAESRTKKVNLIRFYYDDKEDMFDGHSYNKGGQILHFFRNYLGDEAFFEGFKVYLEENRFGAVEAHNLRLAYEKVTGEDLNWFFNQWFFDNGHPELNVSYTYSDSLKMVYLTIKQEQDITKYPVYSLPLTVRLYEDKKPRDISIELNTLNETYEIPVKGTFYSLVVDPDNIVPALYDEEFTEKDYIVRYNNAISYSEKYSALKALNHAQFENDEVYSIFSEKAIADDFWAIRRYAIQNVTFDRKEDIPALKQKLINIALNDKDARVRASAVGELREFDDDEELLSEYEKMMGDQSYAVMATSLLAINELDEEKSILIAEGLMDEDVTNIVIAVTEVISKTGDTKYKSYIEQKLLQMSGYGQYSILRLYGTYLEQQEPDFIRSSIPLLEKLATAYDPWYLRWAATSAIYDVVKAYRKKIKEINSEISSAKMDVDRYNQLIDELMETINNITDQEKDDKAKNRYKAFQ